MTQSEQSIDYVIRDNLCAYAHKRSELRIAESRRMMIDLAFSRAVRQLKRKWDNE